MPPGIHFYEAFSEEVEALRRHLPAHVRADFSSGTIQERGDARPPARIISIRTQSVVPSAWSEELSGVVSRTTGYDHLIGLNVPCGYLPTYCSRAVAEQAFLMVMALMRKLPAQTAQMPTFCRDGLTGSECEGANLLVVGVGRIGSEVVKIGKGLGMNVRGIDPVRRHAWVSYVDPDPGLSWADAIVCAMNLTSRNRGYFRYETLARAKTGAVFVNVARGEVAPLSDLARLLDERRLGGVGLDVYEGEPDLAAALRSGRAKTPFQGRPNVILTPHNAFNTFAALERKARQTAEQTVHFLEHGTPLWPVPRDDP